MLFGLKCDGKMVTGIPSKDVVYLIENGTFPLQSVIFNNSTKAWQKVYENSEIRQLLAKQLTNKKKNFNYDSVFHHWVLKNYISNQGNFSMMEIISKLQNKLLDEKALIRHPTMKDWTELKKISYFSDENVRTLFYFSELKDYFTPRQSPRTIR